MVDTIEKAIRAKLVAHSGLSALIGSRVYPGYIPQGTVKPAVYYDKDEVRKIPVCDENSNYREGSFTITAVADSYTSAESVSAQIESALEQWTQDTPIVVNETITNNDGIMYVEATEEWLGVTLVDIQFFIQ